MIKIGLDIHGCIDLYPKIFSEMTKKLNCDGIQIHVITGQESTSVVTELRDFDIKYDELFSVVDYHKSIGTNMWLGPKGTWYCDELVWNRTKGDYIKREGIDIHFDDTIEYARHIDSHCTFIYVPKFGFEKFYNNFKI